MSHTSAFVVGIRSQDIALPARNPAPIYLPPLSTLDLAFYMEPLSRLNPSHDILFSSCQALVAGMFPWITVIAEFGGGDSKQGSEKEDGCDLHSCNY